jgi:hypothetical protein
MYRRECDGLGWKCSIGGYAHFHQAAWKPMREKLVCFDPGDETRRQQMILEGISKEMAEPAS